MVKEGNFPEWIIQDILIDLRNMQVECSNENIVDVIESENVYIKNLILTQLSQQEGISKETREFVFEICEKDANYVTRKRCQEVKSECSFD